MEFRYDVFLSYRHKPLDAAVTQRAFHCLEGYRVPKALQEKGISGVKRVFRDMEELAVSSELSETIVNALNSTRCLLVFCSTDTPSSEWVDREVATFIELGRADLVYALLMNGTPETSFPKSLSRIPDIADRTLDIRDPQGESRMLRRIPEALLPLIARCIGSPVDELTKQHKQRRKRQATLRYAGLSVLLIMLCGVSFWLWSLAEQYRATAFKERSATMDAIDALTYSLPSNLAGVPGTYGILLDVLTENVGQINQILSISTNIDAVEREKAANLEKLATVYTALGEAGVAVEQSREAVVIYRRLYEKSGRSDALFDYASSRNNLGKGLCALGSYDDGIAEIRAAISLQESAAQSGYESEAQKNLALFYHNLGAGFAFTGAYERAIEADEKSAGILGAITARGDTSLLPTIVEVYQNLGAANGFLARYPEAIQWYEKAFEIAEKRYAEQPTHTALGTLSDAGASLSCGYLFVGQYDKATALFEEVIQQKELLAADADNYTAKEALAAAYENFGTNLNIAGFFAEASPWFERAVEIRSSLVRAENPVSQAALARACFGLAENLLDLQRPEAAKPYYEQCLALYAGVAEQLGAYQQAEYLARNAFYQIVYGDAGEALRLSSEARALLPDSSLVGYIHAYALMYAGEAEECLRVCGAISARGAMEISNFITDFQMLRGLGLDHPLMLEIEASYFQKEES